MVPRIRCGAFKGRSKGDFYDRRDCEGPIAAQIEDAYQFVIKNMRVGTRIVNSQRQEVYELPLSAVREAICNAVFHRDYLEPSDVFVAFYEDRLEIVSPGGLVKDFTLEQAKSGISKIRNRGLAPALEYMKDVEGWGGGVSRYFEKCAEAGLPAPRVEEEDGYFRVTFFRKRAEGGAATPFRDPNDLNDPNDPNDPNQSDSANGVKALSGHEDSPLAVKLLSMVEARPNATYQTLGEMCGVSPATVKRALKKLKEEGKLRRVGGTRGSWVVVK